MKRVLMAVLLSLVIVGCGKDYKVYTKKEKREMYDIALEEEKNGKPEKMEYIEELMEKLEIAYKKGDKTAEIELGEWYEESTRYRSHTEEVKDARAGLMDLKW